MTVAACPRHSIRFRGRSFFALVVAPEPPLADWISELDAWAESSPGFFVGRPVVLDLSRMTLSKGELAGLIADLHARDIRIMALEGADSSLPALGMPPVVDRDRQAGALEVADKEAPPAPGPSSLVIDSSVRSGQSVTFTQGDLIVIGSVASGAEVVAGGSIHIYGALRGRAIAGSNGNPHARIFCRKFEAELLGIDGLFEAADEIEQQLRGRPVQAWLDHGAIMMAALD